METRRTQRFTESAGSVHLRVLRVSVVEADLPLPMSIGLLAVWGARLLSEVQQKGLSRL
jgi:hypothetical protein